MSFHYKGSQSKKKNSFLLFLLCWSKLSISPTFHFSSSYLMLAFIFLPNKAHNFKVNLRVFILLPFSKFLMKKYSFHFFCFFEIFSLKYFFSWNAYEMKYTFLVGKIGESINFHYFWGKWLSNFYYLELLERWFYLKDIYVKIIVFDFWMIYIYLVDNNFA